MSVRKWKTYRVSPENDEIINELQIRKIKKTNKPVSRIEILNELIAKFKLAK